MANLQTLNIEGHTLATLSFNPDQAGPPIILIHALLVATVSKAVVKMLISLVIALEDKQYQKAVISEVKQMLTGYLGPLLKPEE